MQGHGPAGLPSDGGLCAAKNNRDDEAISNLRPMGAEERDDQRFGLDRDET